MASSVERRKAYLSKAQQKCSSEQYQELLCLIDQLDHSSSVETVRKRIPELLQGHRDLILGFNQFLPADAPRIELKKQQVQKSSALPHVEPDHGREYTISRQGQSETAVELAPHHFSRLLYPNPVCLLTTCDPNTQERNVMTITWLTPINNEGTFVASMNATRHSASILLRTCRMVLNIPVRGQETLITRIGSCSGRNGDKFERFSISICAPGWQPLSSSSQDSYSTNNDTTTTHSYPHSHSSSSTDSPPPPTTTAAAAIVETVNTAHDGAIGVGAASIARTLSPPDGEAKTWQASNTADRQLHLPLDLAIESSVAHIVATVIKYEEISAHYLLTCQTKSAFVLKPYWSGKTFAPQRVGSLAAPPPPYLTFLGSQTFGYVVTEDQLPSPAHGTGE